jgi:hypothetical protein
MLISCEYLLAQSQLPPLKLPSRRREHLGTALLGLVADIQSRRDSRPQLAHFRKIPRQLLGLFAIVSGGKGAIGIKLLATAIEQRPGEPSDQVLATTLSPQIGGPGDFKG